MRAIGRKKIHNGSSRTKFTSRNLTPSCYDATDKLLFKGMLSSDIQLKN